MNKFAIMPAAALALCFGSVAQGHAQQLLTRQEPSAQGPGTALPPSAAPANPFPTPNPKNFTAATPTRDEVNSFLTALWGYEPNRIWQIMGILQTPAPGVSKIVVEVADKSQPGKTLTTVFFTTPDGHHAIADNVIDFGAKPFAATRATLQAQADGPARDAAGKDLMLVEFSDLQCPHCRDAQATMDNLAQDFPQARIVFENLPLESAHPFAMRAAEEGVCVRKSKGDAAFFTYAQAVYDTQSGLTKDQAEATLAAAVTKAGADPAAVAACASTPAVRDVINAQMQLAHSIGVESTPVLVVNGHPLPLGSLPYDTLKRLIAFQAAQDGMTVQVQPTLSTLK